MSQKEVARIGLYLSPTLKERIDAKAKEMNKTTSALIVTWCEKIMSDEEIDVVEAIRQIEERLTALEDKTKNL